MKPAQMYAEISERVAEIIARHDDPEKAAYLIFRAALLRIAEEKGPAQAVDIARALAYELCRPKGGA